MPEALMRPCIMVFFDRSRADDIAFDSIQWQ